MHQVSLIPKSTLQGCLAPPQNPSLPLTCSPATLPKWPAYSLWRPSNHSPLLAVPLAGAGKLLCLPGDGLNNVTAKGTGEEGKEGDGQHSALWGSRLGWAPPCWPPKQSTLALLHYQPAPPTHAPPPARESGPWEVGMGVCGSGRS